MAVNSVKVKINGNTYNCTYNSSTGAWEASPNAPGKSSFNQDGHYYDVTVVAQDTAGNNITVDSGDSTFGELLRLKVTENTKPVINVTHPTAGAVLTNSKPMISWLVTDADSGVNQDTISLEIDGVAVESSEITKTKSETIYTCFCSKTIEDGNHILTFYATDNDGNKQTASVSFKIDTVPPTLNVSSPAKDLATNNSVLNVYGYTNDSSDSPVSLTVNGVSVEVDSNGFFSTTINLKEGENVVTVISTDSAGQSTTVTRTVTLDTKAPVITSVECVPNPVGVGSSVKISVRVTDE